MDRGQYLFVRRSVEFVPVLTLPITVDRDLGSASIPASAVWDDCVLGKHDTVVPVAPCQKTGS